MSFPTILSPSSHSHTHTCTHNSHLPQYDTQHCDHNYHYHIHSDLVLSLLFTLLPFHFQNDFILFSPIIHTVPNAMIITHTLLTSLPLSHCHSILFLSLHKTHGPDHLQFYTLCPSLKTLLIFSFLPSIVPNMWILHELR